MFRNGPILPGATIGIIGGGQLGRMMMLAARTMGYKVRALDPDPHCPARVLADELIVAPLSDPAAAAKLARQCAVVTIEIERIGIFGLEECARYAPVRPGSRLLALVQDRAAQKAWLGKHGYPIGAWRSAPSFDDLHRAAMEFGFDAYVKACRGGYDGGAQARIRRASDVAEAWSAMGPQAYVVEQALDLEAEISVLVARRPSGESVVYPPALNHHEERILSWSVLPAPIAPSIIRDAQTLAADIANTIGLEGLLVVEMFIDRRRGLLINELAPRPHNSYHSSEQACATSQFEQAVRAICDLPLGSTEVLRPVAIANLLGDLWRDQEPPPFEKVLSISGVRLHLYDKFPPRPRRKMGHLAATGETPEHAVAKAKVGMERLRESRDRGSKSA
ncbi:MAG TPA: 5-(carboxyamino)imidazole ribonucleotide synthase [Candidatus Binataceae bacterium]|nr:5-(carboxyamino)imidazole ribonucleotide synthase [Candidatus Binataceae bacterium]